jgi:hypothetical protein
MKRLPFRRFFNFLTHRLEHRAQIASAEARAYADESLTAALTEANAYADRAVERRAHAASSEAKAYADEGLMVLGEAVRAANKAVARTAGRVDAFDHAVERRAHEASGEAKAYADEGLAVLGEAVRAANRAVVRTAGRVDAFERAAAERAAGDAELRAQIEAMTNAVGDLTRRLQELEPTRRDLESVAEEQQAFRTAQDAVWKELEATRHAHLTAIAEDRDRIAILTDAIGAAESRLDERAETGLREVDAGVRGVQQGLQQAVEDYNRQLRNAEQRIEFVRSETMYELKAAVFKATGGNANGAPATVGRVVNFEKVEAMRSSGLRLNVGCGHIQPEGFVNVDGRELPGVDIVADVTGMPVREGEVAELASSHLVEHFPSHILERVLLPYWFSLLRSGGQLTTVAPDGAAMLKAVNAGGMTFEDFRESIFGSQDYDGDTHYNLITPESFRDTLQRAGFVDIAEDYVARRNGKCFEFRITARKP